MTADRATVDTWLPNPNCADCHGDGGWWTPGPDPDMDACPCADDSRPLQTWWPAKYPTEPPF